MIDNQELIQEIQQEIKERKQALKLLKKQAKTPFPETKFGRAYYKSVKTLTAPFAKMYHSADSNLANPALVQYKKDLEASSAILEKTATIDHTDTNVPEYLTEMVKLVWNIEDSAVYDNKNSDIVDSLRSEINRLRNNNNLLNDNEKLAMLDNLVSLQKQGE